MSYEKLLAQQQGMDAFRNASRDAFNGYDVEKQIYEAKKQALQSAKGIAGQLLGQERLEAALAAPGLGKTALGLVKTGIRAASNPSEFASAAKTAGYNTLKKQFKSLTGRDLPGSTEEARQAVVDEAKNQFKSRTGLDLPEDADEAGRLLEGQAKKFTGTIDDKTPETLETLGRQGGGNPFFTPPARRIPEPGDADFAAFEARQKALETPDMPVGEVESVGAFPRQGLPPPRGRIGSPTPVTESENRANILREAQEQQPRAEPEGVAREPTAEPELPDVESLKPFSQKIGEARQALRPTETRVADTDIAEAQRFGARPIARSLARQPLTPEEAQRAGFRPPTTPRPERVGRIPEEPAPTEGLVGEYLRPGTELRIRATRGEAPSVREAREADEALAQRGQTESFLGDIERGGARVARGMRETATDDELRQAENVARATRIGRQGIRAAARPEGFESIYPDLSNVRASLDKELDATARRTTAPDLDRAIEETGARALRDVDARTGYGLPELEPLPQAPPSFPQPPTGRPAPSTARGEEEFRPGEQSDLQQRLDNLRGRPQLGEEPEGRPELQPEEIEPRTYTNPALNERFGDTAPTQPKLPDPGEPKAPSGASKISEDDEATAEDASKAVEGDIEKTAVKEGGEELAAEAPLDAVPGLGELVMAGTILGSLFHAHHEEKEAEKQSAGAPPTPPKSTAPMMAFDSAPTLDTSSYHSL